MHTPLVQQIKFKTWHERQLYMSFAWLLSCLMCGFLFVTVVEFVAVYSSGIFTIISIVALYGIGIAAIELFRRFWMKFAFTQHCASSATCNSCGSYGLFSVRVGAWPIYAHCEKCDHRWVIGQDPDSPAGL